MFCRETKT